MLILKDKDIYVDMDGVLCDFDTQCVRYLGLPFKSLEKLVGEKETWDSIHKIGEEFWLKMPWTLDGQELWNLLKQFKPIILSAPASEIKYCAWTKAQWIKNNIDENTPYLFTKAKFKQCLSKENSILIDDYELNISQWNSGKGIGITYTTFDNFKEYILNYGNDQTDNPIIRNT